MAATTLTETEAEQGTLFLDTKKHWVLAVRTPVGFRHIDLGTVTSFPTKAQAEARVAELAARSTN